MREYTATLYLKTDDHTDNNDAYRKLRALVHSKSLGVTVNDLGITVYEVQETFRGKARVHLFKDTGKYATEQDWRIPDNAIGPGDMIHSPDFRRWGGTGAVLVVTQEPWGYPHLIPGLDPRSYHEGQARASKESGT